MPCSVLLVDDEETLRQSLASYLIDQDYEVHTAGGADEGLGILDSVFPDVALVDLRMPGKDGFQFIREARRWHSPMAFIIISAYGDVGKAMEATRLGVTSFLEKPFSPVQLQQAIQLALRDTCWDRALRKVNGEGIRIEGSDWGLVGVSDQMLDVYRDILTVSQCGFATVLVQGESGTGKELVARAIHESSPDNGGRFVDVNCAALSETLLEAELFGHEKGAFTGAAQRRQGLFEAADGGVIFLDEIGDMPLPLQSKLLRVLEQKAFKRVGGVENVKVNLRVIASTNRNLPHMAEEGAFRKDLFYRLNVFSIQMPPLRARPEDIPILSHYFLERYCKAYGKNLTSFALGAMERLTEYPWPGNARELRNVVQRAVIVGSGVQVEAQDIMLPAPHDRRCMPTPPGSSMQSLKGLEKQHIEKVLEQTNWQKAKAARILGINRTTLWHKIKEYGLAKADV